MEKDNPCNSLLNRAFAEILVDEALKKQLKMCLYREVFRVHDLRFFYEENAAFDETAMFIEFTDNFFANQPDLLWSEKPSDTRIKRFYEILKRLQRDFENDFVVSRLQKPSSINLRLRIELTLQKFREDRNQRLDVIPIKDIVEHLKLLWQELLLKLRNYGFNID